jgi:hypothetical protein
MSGATSVMQPGTGPCTAARTPYPGGCRLAKVASRSNGGDIGAAWVSSQSSPLHPQDHHGAVRGPGGTLIGIHSYTALQTATPTARPALGPARSNSKGQRTNRDRAWHLTSGSRYVPEVASSCAPTSRQIRALRILVGEGKLVLRRVRRCGPVLPAGCIRVTRARRRRSPSPVQTIGIGHPSPGRMGR